MPTGPLRGCKPVGMASGAVDDGGMRRPRLTVKEAAKAAGVSVDTIRRSIRSGKFPEAAQDQDASAAWRIPVEDLIAAGFRLHTPDLGEPIVAASPPPPAPDEALVARNRELESENRALRARVEVYESTVEAFKAMARALPPASVQQGGSAQPPPEPTRQGRWRRRSGREQVAAQPAEQP